MNLWSSFLGKTVIFYFINVNFDCFIPTSCNHSIIHSSVSDERNFALLWIMLIKNKWTNTRNKIINFDFSLMTTNYKFSVIWVQLHTGNIWRKNILNDSHGHTSSSIPNFYGSITSNINFKTYWWKLGTCYWIVVREFMHKRFTILIYFELSESTN